MPKPNGLKGDSGISGHLAVLRLAQILAYDASIDNAARRVFCILAGYAGPEGECWPSIKQIAQSLGMSRAAVSKQIDILIDHQYLIKRPRYKSNTRARTTNVYIFNIALARDYYKTPDIFSKKNVTLIVSYLVTLLSYRGVTPLEFRGDGTYASDTKITKKKTYLKKQNKNECKAASRADAWERENERREALGISVEQNRKLRDLYEELKGIIGTDQVVSFNIHAQKSLKSSTPTEQVDELIVVYQAELSKQQSKK